MKHCTYLFLFFAMAGTMFSQSLTLSDAQSLIGKSTNAYDATSTTGFMLDPGGSSPTWDFTTLQYPSQPSRSTSYMTGKQGLCANNVNMADANTSASTVSGGKTSWTYYNLSASGFSNIGICQDTTVIYMTPGILQIGAFPISKGSTWTSTSQEHLGSYTIPVIDTGWADAVGTVKIPTPSGGTVQVQAIRIKLSQTITIGLTKSTTYTYSWSAIGNSSYGPLATAIVDNTGKIISVSYDSPLLSSSDVADRNGPVTLFRGTIPNPVNDQATIAFSLQKPATVSIDVYDMRGSMVRSVAANQLFSAGEHTVPFASEAIPSGTYTIIMRADGFMVRKEMAVVR